MSWTKGMGVIMGELGDSIRRCEQNLQATTTQFSTEIKEIKQRLQLLEDRVTMLERALHQGILTDK